MRELGVAATTALYKIHIGVYNILYVSDSLDCSEILVQGGQRWVRGISCVGEHASQNNRWGFVSLKQAVNSHTWFFLERWSDHTLTTLITIVKVPRWVDYFHFTFPQWKLQKKECTCRDILQTWYQCMQLLLCSCKPCHWTDRCQQVPTWVTEQMSKL